MPGDVWRLVLVLGPAGEVLHSLTLRVPGRGHRCDQHADDAGRIVTATAAGRWLAERIDSRPRARQLAPQQQWTAQDEADAAAAHEAMG